MSFRSAVCVSATGLLLGAVFSRWVVDYGILWQSPVLPSAQKNAELYYAAPDPAWLIQALLAVASVAIAALVSRLAQGSTSSVLFDGGSLVLYLASLTVYGSNVRDSLQQLQGAVPGTQPTLDILKDLGSAHLLISVALTGVISLQAGQFFAERQVQNETDSIERQAIAAAAATSPQASPAKRSGRRSQPSTPAPSSPVKLERSTPAAPASAGGGGSSSARKTRSRTAAAATTATPEASSSSSLSSSLPPPLDDGVVVEVPAVKRSSRRKTRTGL